MYVRAEHPHMEGEEGIEAPSGHWWLVCCSVAEAEEMSLCNIVVANA
jgi:hypothetical protein